MSLYQYPQYYDVAFGYRDIDMECDFIEKKLGLYGLSDNTGILDIACGTGTHMVQLGLRGYEVDGFDISPRMVSYAQTRALDMGVQARVWVDNMAAFSVERTYGAAINLLTGFNYLLTNDDALSHLDRVANALDPGGIYVLELNHPRDFVTNRPSTTNSWVESRGDVEVEVDWDRDRTPVDILTHQTSSRPRILVQDEGRSLSIDMEDRYRIFLYKEMELLLRCNGCFELVDQRGSFKLDNPLDNSRDSWRMILVLRKK